MEQYIKTTMENLEKNNMNAYYVENTEELLKTVKGMISNEELIGIGGSVTLKETGVRDLLSSGEYNFVDAFVPTLTREEAEERFRKCFYADTYFSSSNAITENGEIYNVDGNNNRVAAIMFGPRRVIIVVGKNKIVKDVDEAVKRVKTIAAPKNVVRLNCDTYCFHKGKCVSEKMGGGCLSDRRICCGYTLMSFQRVKGRVNVIIVGEDLGY